MTDDNASVTYKVYGYDTNAHWRNLVRDGRAVRLDSGADERGECVRVALAQPEAVTVFAGGRR